MDLPVMPPVAPMLAKPVPELPDGPWSFEPKWDGFRTIVFRDGDEVELGSRNERPMTRYFPEVVEAVRAELPARCVMDAELAVPDAEGRRLDFDALLLRIHPAASRVALLAEQTPARLVAFDLLALDETDYMGEPFARRRAALEQALAEVRAPVHLTPATTDRGLAMAGVIGAFPMERRRELFAELQPLVTTFEGHPWDWGAWQRESEAEGRTWRGSNSSRWNPGKELSFVPLRPERVVEVRYDHLEGRRFRHTAQFLRWRPDRDPRSCTYDQLEETVSYDLADVLATPAT